jgi:hypothetical protein
VTAFPAFDGTQNCRNAITEGLYIEDSYGRLPKPVKALCNGCPFLDPCLEWGVQHERFGLWGGTDDRDRESIRSLRGISATVPMMRFMPAGRRRAS